MALIETGKCKIEKLSSKGFGLGRTEMGDVELPYLLPGDEVEFERHAYRGKGNCLTISVKKGDHPRKEAPCEYFGRCGGCSLQHLTEEDYTNLKLSMATNPLDNRDIKDYILNPIITVPEGNRRRANLEAIKRKSELYFGFHPHASFRITDIRKCIAMDPTLSNILEPLREVVDKMIEDRQKAQLFLTKAANGIDLWVEIQNVKSLEENIREILKEFAIKHNLVRLIFRHRKFQDVIYQSEEPYILFDDVKVSVDASCFLQSSAQSDKILSDMVVNYASGSKSSVDLFCGRGTYTLPLSSNAKVDGFESDKKALQALGASINETDRDINLFRRDLFTSPVPCQDFKKYDFCVINPPRAGAENQIKEIANSGIQKICYVSCNPKTFARDAEILIQAGYKLKEVSPVDQFFWASHLEIVGYFEF